MSKLFKPLKLGSGSVELGHRVAMAPLTRYRNDDDRVPLPIVKEYYVQRASTPGTLLITEATLISLRAASRNNVPGLWSDAQIAAWREIVDAVHGKDCRIFCQLWHLGRAGHGDVLRSHGDRLLSPSAVAVDETREVPEEMTEADIRDAIADYAAAARNAMKAGFDGVEIHGANGYLPDQFLQDVCNKRTDRWGGSIENRARFHLEVTKAVAEAVGGADKVGMRLSPHSEYLGMRMADPMPTFEYLVGQLKELGPLAYLHLVEGRISGQSDTDVREGGTNTPLVKVWDNSSPVLLAGGFTPESAREVVDRTYKDYDVVVVFGRHFIANPDLVFRLEHGVPLNKYDRPTFYLPKVPDGYIDYPFSREFEQRVGVAA